MFSAGGEASGIFAFAKEMIGFCCRNWCEGNNFLNFLNSIPIRTKKKKNITDIYIDLHTNYMQTHTHTYQGTCIHSYIYIYIKVDTKIAIHTDRLTEA